MKRCILFFVIGLTCFLHFNLSVQASMPSFNVSSKEKMLGSVFDNLKKVNENFTDIENPYYNPELYKYGLIINDIINGNTNYTAILNQRGVIYSIDNTTSNVATVYSVCFQYQTSSLYPEGYTDDFERLKLQIDINYNGIRQTWRSSTFYRYYNGSGYGLPYTYAAKKTIEYSVNKEDYYKVTLIDNRKLIIYNTNDSSNKFEISKTTHYCRNDNNPTDLPNPRKNDFTMSIGYGMIWDSSAYFHKIGEYDGDTSNIKNVKHTCNVGNLYRYEVVYNGSSEGAIMVTSPTVMGTYNFALPANGNSHRIKDVLPYLIWGNAENDNTTLKERFYFDYDDFSGGTNYTKRGNSLFHAVNLGSYLSYNLDELNDRIQNPVVLEYLYE